MKKTEQVLNNVRVETRVKLEPLFDRISNFCQQYFFYVFYMYNINNKSISCTRTEYIQLFLLLLNSKQDSYTRTFNFFCRQRKKLLCYLFIVKLYILVKFYLFRTQNKSKYRTHAILFVCVYAENLYYIYLHHYFNLFMILQPT